MADSWRTNNLLFLIFQRMFPNMRAFENKREILYRQFYFKANMYHMLSLLTVVLRIVVPDFHYGCVLSVGGFNLLGF